MSHKVLYGSIWSATIAVAYLVGYLGQEDSPTDPIDAETEKNPQDQPNTTNYLDKGERGISSQKESDVESQKAGSKGKHRNDISDISLSKLESSYLQETEVQSESESIRPLTADEIREKLGSALTSCNLVTHNRAIADLLARLSPENAREALRVFENTPRAYHTDNNYRLFLHAWAKVDGKAAFEYIHNNPNAHLVGGGHIWAMSGWTQSDPQAAFDYVQSMKKPVHGLYHGLVRGWGRVDLEGANAYVASLKDDHLRRRLVGVIGESYVEQRGIKGALDWATETARTTKDKNFASAALDDVIKRAVSQNPSHAADWISSNRDHPHLKSWMFEHAAGRIADSNPSAAAEWLTRNLNDDRVNGRVAGRVAREWAEREPAAAAKWADSLRGTKIFNKDLAERLAGTWATQDSSAALEWANTLDSDLRRPAYGSIVGKMPREQLEATAEWIRKAPEDSVLDGARAAYALRMSDEKPREALEQAMMMTDELGREKITVGVAQKMYRRNPKSIKEWLPKSGLSVAAQQRVIRGN